jgi:hypothetical protein
MLSKRTTGDKLDQPYAVSLCAELVLHGLLFNFGNSQDFNHREAGKQVKEILILPKK